MDNTNVTVEEEVTTVKKKRGRPATCRKTEREVKYSLADSELNNKPQFGGKPDNLTLTLIQDALSMLDTKPVDVHNPEEVKQRTIAYLQRCAELERRPAIAAYAFFLGIQRTTLNNFVYGRSNAIHPDSLAVIKSVYSLVDGSMEQQIQEGSMNVIAGIFLMRNNLNYTNVDTVEIVPKAPESNAARLDDVIAEYSNDNENKE